MTKTESALIAALLKYDRVALKFIAKVDNGEARSSVTYAELKEALETSKEARGRWV